MPALPVGVLSMFIVELHIELAHTNPAENHLGMAETEIISNRRQYCGSETICLDRIDIQRCQESETDKYVAWSFQTEA